MARGIFYTFYIMKKKPKSLLPLLEFLAYIGIATYTAIRVKRRIKETFTMYDGVSTLSDDTTCSSISAEKTSVLRSIVRRICAPSTLTMTTVVSSGRNRRNDDDSWEVTKGGIE